MDIHRPVVSGFFDKAFEKLLNKKIENKISADKYNAEISSQKPNKLADQFNFSVDYWLKSSVGILSPKVTTDFYYGWVTDTPTTIYYNADIANNKMLTLGDLFTDDSYKTILDMFLTTAIAQNYQKTVPIFSKASSIKQNFS